MPPENQPNHQYWDLLGILLIALMSGFISVGRRLLRKTNPSIMWVLTEFCAAVLAGYLAWGLIQI
nr:MAG: holin, superfamily III protein [Bacteriophage sp.]